MQSIEDTIFKSLLFDERYARKVLPHLDNECFDGSYKTLFNVFSRLFENYNKIPNYEALALTLQNESINQSEFDEILSTVEGIIESQDNLVDTDWLIDETEDFVRNKKIYNGIYRSIDILEGNDKQFDRHAIPEILNEALSIDFDPDTGLDYFEDVQKRYEHYTAEDTRLRFPIEALNLLSNGGHKRKALSCILAPTNHGKSSLMCFLAGEWLKQGYNVMYISLEMAAEDIQERVDANLLDVKTDDLGKLSYEEFKSKTDKLKEKTQGRFFAKQYPTGAGHAGHFRHYIKELKQKKNFKPDVIFVDYVNICASSRTKMGNNVNSYTLIKSIAEELRGLAVEFDVHMMTATQVNRGGYKSDEPDMDSTSESFALPATLDFYIALSSDEQLRQAGQQLVHLLKTRWGNKQKVSTQAIAIDFDKMRYKDVGSTRDLQDKVGGGTSPQDKINSSKEQRLKEKRENLGNTLDFSE